VLEASRLEPRSLVIEITETTLMHDTEASIAKLEALKALGVRLAVDDFGTGYSSLGYLRRFPFDILNLDKSFVDGVTLSPEDAACATPSSGSARPSSSPWSPRASRPTSRLSSCATSARATTSPGRWPPKRSASCSGSPGSPSTCPTLTSCPTPTPSPFLRTAADIPSPVGD
jgi:hypothetical protein